MRYILLGTIAGCLFFGLTAKAQNAFWGFDENNQEVYIPTQCDGQFDEAHGGVFMPTPEELFEQGETLLLEKDNTRNGAGYCLLSAAIQGYVPAQFRVAQLYNKGLILPQNDIAAYRWAFLASLNGNKEAEQLALTLEQLLSADEIQMATKPLEPMLPGLKQEKDSSLEEQEEILKEKKAELENINKEIDDLLGIKYTAPRIKSVEEIRSAAQESLQQKEEKADSDNNKQVLKENTAQPLYRRRRTASKNVPADKGGPLFTEKDRLK